VRFLRGEAKLLQLAGSRPPGSKTSNEILP
jgi:hypothetical protein